MTFVMLLVKGGISYGGACRALVASLCFAFVAFCYLGPQVELLYQVVPLVGSGWFKGKRQFALFAKKLHLFVREVCWLINAWITIDVGIVFLRVSQALAMKGILERFNGIVVVVQVCSAENYGKLIQVRDSRVVIQLPRRKKVIHCLCVLFFKFGLAKNILAKLERAQYRMFATTRDTHHSFIWSTIYVFLKESK